MKSRNKDAHRSHAQKPSSRDLRDPSAPRHVADGELRAVAGGGKATTSKGTSAPRPEPVKYLTVTMQEVFISG